MFDAILDLLLDLDHDTLVSLVVAPVTALCWAANGLQIYCLVQMIRRYERHYAQIVHVMLYVVLCLVCVRSFILYLEG